MYESFYGLRKGPFAVLEPDTQYIGEQQHNTLSKLINDILSQVGATVVSGEVGCGKSTLVRYLNSRLENEVTVGVSRDTPCAFSSFMHWILQAFEVKVTTSDAVELHQAFLDFISAEFAEHRNVVLIVDEAHRLSARNLEELILLTYAYRGDWMFQVVLVGQPKLRDMLRHRDMGYLTQRIAVEYQLSPFNLDQTKEYILYRIKLAGGDPELFDAQACELVYKYSKGIPRLINSICDTALLQGYEKKQRILDGPLITEIVSEQTVAKTPGFSELQSIALKNGIDNTKIDSLPSASSTSGHFEHPLPTKDEVLLGNDNLYGNQAPIGREQNDSKRLHTLVEARADSSPEATATIRSNNIVPLDSRCLHHLFEAQVDVRPQDLALICGSRRLSYEELEHRSNQLAYYLRSFGVGPGKLVSLYFERSEKPIVALLAVLKAGAGYVPIDPNFPMDRVRHILEDADVSLLLTENDLSTQASSFFQGSTVLFDGHAEEINKQPIDRLVGDITRVSPNDLCYIIYTSGTTGRPKGIMTEHHNVVRFTNAFNEVCRLSNRDRIYQGFSLGFDGSVEEIWMAFSNGATLVVGTPEIVRFGNEVARLLTEQQVTFFSTVPTFLSLINEDLPTVRLVVVSGEQCPPELVEKWAKPGRRLLNVYGPTETTVNTTAAECVPGKPVTIGRPLQGYQIYILDAQMKPVPPGEAGELYIGGVGLARGYLNQPELTLKHFVANPLNEENGSSRLYRTGDLVSEDDDGELKFLGRIDSQVKIRGFRIELSEIEAVLREHPMIYAAVVNVFEREGLRELAAYVVLCNTAGSFERDSVLELLQKRLPAYMVPGYLDLLEELPTLASGKINRKRLPEPSTPLVRSERKIVTPSSELERKIAGIWQTVFKISPISIEDDFFLDLGGYSLLAAQVVTQLRSELKLDASIRDIYRYTTIRRLAKYFESSVANDASGLAADQKPTPRRTSREVLENLSRITRWCCIGLQAISIPLIYGLVFAPVLILVWTSIAVLRGDMAIEVAILIAVALLFGTLPMMLAQSIALKWLVIGRYKPGKYPVWGFYYLRWWLVTRVHELSGTELLSGTPVMSLYYRLMGARVGRNCIIDTAACAIYDLVKIGEDTCVGSETQILGYRIEDGMLIIGTIEIGSGCYIGIHSALGLNTRMDDNALLDDLSLLPDGETMAAGESRRGSPAQPAEILLPEVENQAKHRHPFIFGLIHLALAQIVGVFIFITAIPFFVITIVSLLFGGIPLMIASLFVAVPLHVVWFCLAIAAIKALILGRSKPGVYSVESWFFLRKWTVDALLTISYGFLLPLYTTVYLPPWLRLLGAKIGARAEISTVSQLSPDLVVIDAESFFADGSMIGSKRFFRGHVEFAMNRIGSRSFVGNNAIVPLHSSIGDNCLLGVLSAPPANLEQMPHGTEWLGSPAFQLPHRQKVDGFDISVTHQPTTKLYLQRYIIDALRILIPNFIVAWGLIAFITFVVVAYLYLPLWAIVVIAPPVALVIAVGSAASVIVLKKLLMAPFKPVIKPLWSTYVWWNEVINGAYETIAAPALSPMMGTPFFNWYLRLLGCKIGKHVFIETGLFSEFDLVDIGDYAALNQDVVVQNHLFEDRIMKSSYIRIGDECSVGNMSVVLYDTVMQKSASVGPLSLLMKGETLPPRSRWLGIPISERASRETDGKRKILNMDDWRNRTIAAAMLKSYTDSGRAEHESCARA